MENISLIYYNATTPSLARTYPPHDTYIFHSCFLKSMLLFNYQWRCPRPTNI